ncbi:MAG TPA: lytic transglycosylase domain-containing protein [Longimicrobiales bacterium]|nr:lytic transglycosylase domain-containing protein [Longimicrobiales bacterium]
MERDRQTGSNGRSKPEGGDGAMRQSAEPIGAAHVAGRGEQRASGGAGEHAGDDNVVSRRERLGRHAATVGLAASSLALLAGVRGGSGDSKPASVAVAAAFLPPAQVTEQKGVTWDLHMSDHERIDFFVEYLMGKNYDKTRTWLERIGKYGPLVQNELRERAMPEDLLFLTMIESGLDPNAYSKAHAAGLWQFIEETGKRYGLEVSPYVDERRDPIKATAAALTYLQEMHERFDSWYLSAAGYNTGENRVGRLMRETTGSERGSDEGYWAIWDRLPSETRDYVPLMLAMGKIAKEPEKHGFRDLQYEQPLQFEQVTVPGGTKLADVAAAAGADAAIVYDLNPHLVRKQTPPGRELVVRVPVGQGARVASAFNSQVVNVAN